MASIEGANDDVAAMTFLEARTALDLALAALQSDSLEIEEMVQLHRRASAYADHCRRLLDEVEQEVIQLDADDLISDSPAAP
jgi:exodeoxyribonuclease VII small subunit